MIADVEVQKPRSESFKLSVTLVTCQNSLK